MKKNKNNEEVEIKLTFGDKSKVLEKIKPEFELQEEVEIHDIYYSDEETDMKNTHNLLRVREKGDEKEITLKGKTEDKENIWHRRELTTEIGDASVMKEILTALDFNKISEYKSKREYWHKGEVEIVFSQFGLPAELEFMEIEGPFREAVRKIKDQLSDVTEEAGEEIFEVFDKAREENSK